MRTQEQIIKRIEERKENDFLGFETNEYITFLDADHVMAYMKEEYRTEDTRKEWASLYKKPEKALLLSVMKDYMSFAWEKANNRRGISAQRSMMHYIAWIWLIEDDAFLNKITKMYREEYQHYGKEILIEICEHYGWDWKSLDNGERVNTDG